MYSRELGIVGDLGYENNTFASLRNETKAIIWDFGVHWLPTERTNLLATFGHRFFGDRYYVDFSHRTRRTTWLFNYSEEAFTTRRAQLENAVTEGEDGGLPTLDPDVFIRRSLTAGVNYEGIRDRWSIRFYRQQREFQTGPQRDQELVGSRIAWVHRISPLIDLNTNFSWSNIDSVVPNQIGPNQNRIDDFFYVELGLTKLLGRNVTGNIGYRWVDRLSTDDANEYIENRLMANLAVAF
jgi:hypothetical protein